MTNNVSTKKEKNGQRAEKRAEQRAEKMAEAEVVEVDDTSHVFLTSYGTLRVDWRNPAAAVGPGG
jgi:hypothetical protein